jgi:hypothetical protein
MPISKQQEGARTMTQYTAATQIGKANVQIASYPVVQKTLYREIESGKVYYTTHKNMKFYVEPTAEGIWKPESN